MASLAYDLQRSDASRWEELPWRGYWGLIAWARNQMDQRLRPYAAAQRVLELVGNVNELWAPCRGETLMRLLKEWDDSPGQRDALDDSIREVLRSLQATDVRPLADDLDSSR
jgi:hypothetical protein